MARKKRKVPSLNASSTADISFILLIFFLVTTSMDTDAGLARRLPPPPEDEQAEMDVKERNVLNVKVNAAGQIMCGGDFIEIDQLCDKAKEFVKNDANSPNLPEKHLKNSPLLGQCAVTDKHVISVQTDRGTPYNVYFQVQNELVRAYNELRDELSKAKFGRVYAALDEDHQVAVREYYPQKISEAEPKNYGGNK